MIAGDLLYGSHNRHDPLLIQDQVYVLPFIKACTQITPSYLSLGNHEMMLSDEDIKCIKKTGIFLLDNDWKIYPFHKKNIILDHHPEYYDFIDKNVIHQIDLIISGQHMADNGIIISY